MAVIVLAGMIALGKSSLAEILGNRLDYEVLYESVEDNPILPLFYTASPEEIQAKRYPFLLQLHFLDTRFRAIKKALKSKDSISDRSIYEDWYFAKKNMELGRMSEIEFNTYEKLLNNMMDEIDGMPKKAPDLMIYLRGGFETVMNRIINRGREFELSDELRDYYYFIWKDYDNWVMDTYKSSPFIIVDMDEFDVVNNKEDSNRIVDTVIKMLVMIRGAGPMDNGYVTTVGKPKKSIDA